MADQSLRAQFFLIRENDTMVPLIAMDELPVHITVRGVPRNLTPRDIQGMTCIGTFATRHQTHSVINTNQSPATPLKTPETVVASKSSEKDSSSSSRAGGQSVYSSTETRLKDDIQSLVVLSRRPGAEVISNDVKNLPIPRQRNEDPFPQLFDPANSSSLPVPESPRPRGMKEFCSYWLRTGNCDFTQQGCMYKHEMPTDLPTLNSLGLRDIPAWYRQSFGLGSYLAASGADASFSSPDLKSVIASTSKPVMARIAGNWRTAAPHDTSSAASDHQPGFKRATRPGRKQGKGLRNGTAGSLISTIKPLSETRAEFITVNGSPVDTQGSQGLPIPAGPARRGQAALHRSKHAPPLLPAPSSQLPLPPPPPTVPAQLPATSEPPKPTQTKTKAADSESSPSGDSSGGVPIPAYVTKYEGALTPRRQQTRNRRRRVSNGSEYSDFEAEILRADSERKAREERGLGSSQEGEDKKKIK